MHQLQPLGPGRGPLSDLVTPILLLIVDKRRIWACFKQPEKEAFELVLLRLLGVKQCAYKVICEGLYFFFRLVLKNLARGCRLLANLGPPSVPVVEQVFLEGLFLNGTPPLHHLAVGRLPPEQFLDSHLKVTQLGSLEIQTLRVDKGVLVKNNRQVLLLDWRQHDVE